MFSDRLAGKVIRNSHDRGGIRDVRTHDFIAAVDLIRADNPVVRRFSYDRVEKVRKETDGANCEYLLTATEWVTVTKNKVNFALTIVTVNGKGHVAEFEINADSNPATR